MLKDIFINCKQWHFENDETCGGCKMLAKNHKIIGTSEMYSSTQMREHGIESVKKNGITMVLVDETSSSNTGLGTAATVTVKPERSEEKRYA